MTRFKDLREAYNWMLNGNEPMLITSRSEVTPEMVTMVKHDYKLHHWDMEENEMLYYLAWDFSMTVSTVKWILK